MIMSGQLNDHFKVQYSHGVYKPNILTGLLCSDVFLSQYLILASVEVSGSQDKVLFFYISLFWKTFVNDA